MSLLQIAGTGFAVIFAIMTLLWIVSLLLKDSSIVDIFWGTGFVILAWIYFFLSPGTIVGQTMHAAAFPRRLLVLALVTIWGLRLSIYILIRNWGHGEDYRYQQMRKQAGTGWWWQSYFRVFVLQGLLMVVISAPLLAVQFYLQPAELNVLDILGIMLWTIGFFFEAVGDAHLRHFKKDPNTKGKLLTSGVWTYTRHPNYFGDAAQWWAYYLFALATLSGWWTFFGPLLMTFFLIRVSGVALLEKSLKKQKPGYKEYAERTNAFIPGLPANKN